MVAKTLNSAFSAASECNSIDSLLESAISDVNPRNKSTGVSLKTYSFYVLQREKVARELKRNPTLVGLQGALI
ncbi:hypothetical protein AAC387_Pa09g0195 [Persea americana]